MLNRSVLTVAIGVLLAVPLQAEDQEVGSVKTLEGAVVAVRDGQEIPIAVDDRLFAEDVVRTAVDGSIGIVLRDNTTLSLGPQSELAMKEFDFRPNEGAFSLVVNVIRGTFVYVSGKIAELAPETIKVETPVGSIAVRGTKFLVRIAE